MGASNCSSKVEMKKGPWTREEDQKLLAYIEQHGHGSWQTLPPKAGLERCGKSCRLRWTNYLRPDIKRGKFSPHEEKAIIRLHALLGNRWSAIAAHLPKRTDNEIKNYWNTRLKKRLTRMGIDPSTHKPKNNPASSARSSHMAQWEAARLEAEARLARESKFLLLRRATAPPPPPPRALPCLDVVKVWQATTTPSCLFSSLESPNSTLNFSSCLPAVGPVMPNGVDSMNSYAQMDCYTEAEGKMENSVQLYDYDMMGAMDHASSFDHDDMMGGPDDSNNYWSELLDLVSSTMGLQMS